MACKNIDGCGSAASIAGQLSKAFNANVFALTQGSQITGLDKYIDSSKLKVEEITGTPDKFIRTKATENNIDLIVLPVRAKGSDVGIVSSSEANSIIDYLERMVLSVPAGTKEFKFDKVVVPIDTSFETRQKVPYAEALAQAFGSTIHVLGVSNDKSKDAEVTVQNYARQVCRNIEERGLNYEMEMNLGGNPTDVTLEYAEKVGANLIVIMTEQESNLVSFFSGKYSEQMVKKAGIPVLSIHPKDLVVSEARL